MLAKLAQRINDEVYQRFYDFSTTVFLCGAGTSAGESVRQQIEHELTTHSLPNWHPFLLDIIYPEDLFEGLFRGPGHHDLMTLEGILADSVDAIVLVVESIGAVAELGAFATNPQLRKKLVCVVDSKYRKKKSFINYGPLRLLRSMKQGQIVYGDFENVTAFTDELRKSIRKAKRDGTKTSHVKNVVQAHHFILPSIFLLQPVSRDRLVELVTHASGADAQTATALAAGALSMLSRTREIELSPDGYKLTAIGMKHFRIQTQRSLNLKSMDQLRVGILNWQYRGKPLKV
jgi:hypothetical protein